jgi:hypothetical protein
MPIIGSFGAGSKGGFGRGGGKPYFVRYLVIAGGGSGGASQGGGGGAGGYREIACKTLEVVGGKSYTVTVGAGGPPAPGTAVPTYNTADYNGNPSTFDSITSTGGGAAGLGNPSGPCASPCYPNGIYGRPGGSGGGVGRYHNPYYPGQGPLIYAGGQGNTPPFSPSQGNNGGTIPGGAFNNQAGAGGGAAGSAGNNVTSTPGPGGPGGSGTPSSITGSPVGRAGGGAGGGDAQQGIPVGSPGGSGGGAAGERVNGQAGSANTGGGGGAGGGGAPNAGAGGSGIIVIRRTTACSAGASGGCESICGADTIHVFNSPGTYTA